MNAAPPICICICMCSEHIICLIMCSYVLDYCFFFFFNGTGQKHVEVQKVKVVAFSAVFRSMDDDAEGSMFMRKESNSSHFNYFHVSANITPFHISLCTVLCNVK